jgi:hypothetical protein
MAELTAAETTVEIVAGATRSSRRPRRGRPRIEAPANAARSTIPRTYAGEGSCSAGW